MELQLEHLKKDVDKLQKKHGYGKLNAIYGAGCIKNPKILFLFMNPTARNVSAVPRWKGLRAPWIGTKNVWKILNTLGILSANTYKTIKENNQSIWTEEFAQNVYIELAKKSVYITNLAKCTQEDARCLHDNIFKEYLENTLEEIYLIKPQKIISFGNQVSSILLNKKIKVSDYQNQQKETLKTKDENFNVYPVYYPVGQGMRNIDKAIKRLRQVVR